MASGTSHRLSGLQGMRRAGLPTLALHQYLAL